MNSSHAIPFPLLWVGPAGSGKLTVARSLIGVPPTARPRLLSLEIGDYTARYWEFPTHLEIDVMDLSMMDKQILPEMLTRLLSTQDVLSGRKLLILRRIHGLSPAAARRFRVCLEEFVWSANAPALIWCTARTVNSAVAYVMDGFVYLRVPGPAQAIQKQELILQLTQGQSQNRQTQGQSQQHKQSHPSVDAVPTVQTYIAETLRQMVFALSEGPPTIAVAGWIRGRVYDLLGLMTTGGELVAGLAWATVRMAAAGTLSSAKAKAVLSVLARIRWFPSYRIPLIMELILTEVYNAIAR